MDKFFEALSGKLSENWLQIVLKPAFFFWAGGLLIWAVERSSWQDWQTWISGLSLTSTLAILIGGVLVVQASESFATVIELPVTRFLEGYWPKQFDWLRNWRVSKWNAIRTQNENRFQELQRKLASEILSFRESENLVWIEKKLRSLPSNPTDQMPTRLGNVLRAAEQRSTEKYGLDAVICWPRLWLLLPDGAKNELVQSRAAVDTGVRAWLWSLLFMVWVIWAWWVVVFSLVGMWFTYQRIVNRADVYGDLIDSTFDVYRVTLYKALRWPLPANANEERGVGGKITQYLWRGSNNSAVVFLSSDK